MIYECSSEISAPRLQLNLSNLALLMVEKRRTEKLTALLLSQKSPIKNILTNPMNANGSPKLSTADTHVLMYSSSCGYAYCGVTRIPFCSRRKYFVVNGGRKPEYQKRDD